MKKQNLKDIIYICIENILTRDNKKYAKLKEIYEEVSRYLEIENNEILQSQIRGRLQEHSKQYPTSFNGESLFFTEKVRSGNWTIKKDEIKYIRYIKNKYLISVDDWDTIKTVSVIDSSYVLEENLDNIYKAKLVKLVGSDKANVIINELNDIRILLKDYMHISKTNDGYGTAFEIFSISTIYNIDYIECMKKYIINGDYDGSIDAIYYNDPNYVYIYQIKTNELNDDVYNKMELNYNKCFNNENNSVYKDLYNYITKNKDNLKRKIPKFRSISTNCKKNTNLTPEQIYNMFFKNKLLPIRNNGLSLLIPKPIFETSNGCQYNVSTDGYGNFSFYIKACELINSLLDALGSSLNSYTTKDFSKYFYDNVRGVLSTNKKMIYTIENEPENFLKYNNGINITGEVLDLKNEILIKDPIINNGQQTITTLISHNKNLNKILLPIKITNETNLVIKSKISRFSNEQVKVKSIDMLS
ncbi:MAG: AIPR family protein, partial [bacterium]|nr:AIPR family protein [bacterium]